jgi:hypothetical protein
LCSDGYPFFLTGWDSLQDHLNYMTDKERQASVAEDFGDAMRLDAGVPIIEHVVLSAETTLRVLEAPLTKVARITFSDRASLEKAKPVVEKYVAYANREETLPIAAAFGQTFDLENVEEMKIIFIVGWKTAEVKWLSLRQTSGHAAYGGYGFGILGPGDIQELRRRERNYQGDG